MSVNKIRAVCPVKTPIGILTAVYEGGEIKRVLFPGEEPGAGVGVSDESLPFATQVKEYFEGKRKAFSLPMFIPGTRFMLDVYNATISIPYGSTASYSEVAFAAGYPGAFRAVGNAMHANPLPVLIPCHRVVHKSGNLASYSGGLDIKKFLLDMERRNK
jgi:methylated-DNA-[protein]-cysteine S-methyltransferase